jgi:hypothetical protein
MTINYDEARCHSDKTKEMSRKNETQGPETIARATIACMLTIIIIGAKPIPQLAPKLHIKPTEF